MRRRVRQRGPKSKDEQGSTTPYRSPGRTRRDENSALGSFYNAGPVVDLKEG